MTPFPHRLQGSSCQRRAISARGSFSIVIATSALIAPTAFGHAVALAQDAARPAVLPTVNVEGVAETAWGPVEG